MADNITVSDSTTTNSKLPDSTVIATDDVSGVQFQKVKVDLGGDGASQVPDTNSGSKSAGTLRVVIATDQPALSNKLLVTPDLPSGASTSAKQDTIIGHVDGIETLLGTIDADTSTIAGAVSGTEMQVDVLSSALPTGAATEAKQDTVIGHLDGVEGLLTTIDGDTGTIAGAVSGTEMQVDVVAALPAGTNTIGVVLDERVSTATVTSVSDTASSTQLLASTAGRKGASFYNNSTEILYLKLGTTASTTDFTVAMAASSFYELPQPVYTGRIDGIWANNSTGAVLITELT